LFDEALQAYFKTLDGATLADMTASMPWVEDQSAAEVTGRQAPVAPPKTRRAVRQITPAAKKL
jgi:hypothetical protein